MSRRRAAIKRKILPDPVYHSVKVARFITRIMKCGKKSIAEKLVYSAFEKLERDHKPAQPSAVASEANPVLVLFEQAIEKLSPKVEVRSRRVGGATYQVPVEVRPERREALAMRWLIEAARGRSEKSMAFRVAAELKDVLEGRGSALKKLENMISMARANQAFAHVRISN